MITLAELWVAECALREEPYDRLPALAGTLAIARQRIANLEDLETWCSQLVNNPLTSSEWNQAMDMIGTIITEKESDDRTD